MSEGHETEGFPGKRISLQHCFTSTGARARVLPTPTAAGHGEPAVRVAPFPSVAGRGPRLPPEPPQTRRLPGPAAGLGGEEGEAASAALAPEERTPAVTGKICEYTRNP